MGPSAASAYVAAQALILIRTGTASYKTAVA